MEALNGSNTQDIFSSHEGGGESYFLENDSWKRQ